MYLKLTERIQTQTADSRRLREAIALVLWEIKSYYTEEKYDVENFQNEKNERLKKALLMAFDPFTNKEVEGILGEQMDAARMHEYYRIPVMCLLRIKDSIDTWEKRSGVNGYFLFVEQYMGAQVKGNDMDFSVVF